MGAVTTPGHLSPATPPATVLRPVAGVLPARARLRRRVQLWHGCHLVFFCLAFSSSAWAQGVATGALSGRTVDLGGGAVADVVVSVVDTATGAVYRAVSDPRGSFYLGALPPSTYDVEVEHPGFAALSLQELPVHVATVRSLVLRMTPTQGSELIFLTDQPPLIRSSPALGIVVGGDELRSLPSSGRHLLHLGALSPGTGPALTPTSPSPPQGSVATNGGNGTNVHLVIDGGDSTHDQRGGPISGLGIEAVSEMNIQTQQYDAAYGRSTGGVVNVVTRSGTKRLAGSVFALLRDEDLSSTPESRKRAGIPEPAFEHRQFGGSSGGPLGKGGLHFFVAYEGSEAEEAGTAAGSGPHHRLSTQQGTAKLTLRPSQNRSFRLRTGHHQSRGRPAPTRGPSPGGSPATAKSRTEFDSLLFGYTQSLKARAHAELFAQYSEGESLDTGPVHLRWRQEKLQLRQDFTLAGALGPNPHELKLGMEWIHEPVLEGSLPALPVAGLADLSAPPVVVESSHPNSQWSGYLQDRFTIHSRLVLHLGLRYEYTDLLRLDQRSNPIWQTLSSQPLLEDFYLREFHQGGGGVLSADSDDFAPRVGLAWDVNGDGRHLVVSGWGLFYGFPYTQSTVFYPAAALGRSPADPLGHGDVASPTLRTPYSTQLSLGYSRQVTPWLGFNGEGVGVRYRSLPFRFGANPRVDLDGDDTLDRRRIPELGTFRLWYGKGRAEYHGVNLSVHARFAGRFQLRAFYTWSRARGNVLAGADDYRLTDPGHQPELAGPTRDTSVDPLNPLCDRCFGALNTDARNRLTVSGTFRGPLGITFAGIVRWRDALPFTLHAGQDLNGDGFALDLPAGVPEVNSGRGASFSQVDLRISRVMTLAAGLRLELLGEVFNLFDDPNPAGHVGALNAENFDQPTTFAGDPHQGEQRLGQLGVRLWF